MRAGRLASPLAYRAWWSQRSLLGMNRVHTGLNKDNIEQDLLFPQACRIISQMPFTRPVLDHEMPLVRC